MVVEVFRAIRWLNAALHRRIGPAYGVVISIGLVAEIVRRVHEAGEHLGSGVIRPGLYIVFCGLLLLQQLAELGERVEQRSRAATEASGRKGAES